MTKHKYSFENNAPSIMEPVDETPSLTQQADLLDAMKPDILYEIKPDITNRHESSFKMTTKDVIIDHHNHQKQSSSLSSSSSTTFRVPSVFDNKIDKTKQFQHTLDSLKSINIHYEKSFLLIDGKEKLYVPSAEIFCKQLGCTNDMKVKVVSIFGNTGDGKSHTMNNVFFNGDEIFRTSAAQDSCTLGVWAAYQPEMGILCLDTEGLLGATTNENQRMRMLLKVLAISDIVIYRTRSERLHSDMFTFLGTASKAFHKHFSNALQALGLPGPPQALGPAVIIFHETRNTQVIESTVDKSVEDILRERFAQMNIDLEAFSSLRYVGIQTTRPPTNYGIIKTAVGNEIENTSVRSPRQPDVIFKAIDALNLKFSGKICEKSINPFPEQYFTCGVHCESCGERCERSMGHTLNGIAHRNENRCRYQHQYENKKFLCKMCHINGREVAVRISTQTTNDTSWFGLAKYAWSGSVIECPNCGEIFRARQYWYGNKSPEDVAVRTEIVHVWQDHYQTNDGPKHSAQMVLDHVNYLSETITSISAPPSKVLTGWFADKIAPSYWKPNAEIINCHGCKINFEQTELPKHHCRGCGEGFCNSCSIHELPVPARGWTHPARVCNSCKDILTKNRYACPEVTETTQKLSSAGEPDEQDVNFRKYGEVVFNTLSSVASVLEYPKDLIKDSARPSYWVPDIEAPNCSVCKEMFGTAEELTTSATKHNANGFVNGNAGSVNNGGGSNGGGGGESPKLFQSPTHLGQRQIFFDRKRHHCRSCGQAVCNPCSLHRQPVPERGWNTDVRVCDPCSKSIKC